MNNIAEIKARADISQVWHALGGDKLRGRRGRAFWRDGYGFNVALYPQTGTWHDFGSGEGGDTIGLVEMVRQCGFRDACEWLADFTGTPAYQRARHERVDADNNWQTDLKWATWWGRAAEILAEQALEELPSWSLLRRGPTVLLQTIRLGDAALVAEYRTWRFRDPELTAAMAHAGQRCDARIQRRLALWIRRSCDGAQTS